MNTRHCQDVPRWKVAIQEKSPKQSMVMRISRLVMPLALGLGLTLLSLALLSGGSLVTHAQGSCVAGPHSGTISSDESWCLAHSPHLIDGDVTVAAGVTLTVEPGVVVKGQSDTQLIVQGTLNALGTSSQPITFTSSADSGADEWEGLYFNGGSGTLEHVTVRYAGESSAVSGASTAIYVKDSAESVTIRGSQVLTNSYSGNVEALRIEDSRVVVSNTTFAYNSNTSGTDYALYARGMSMVTVQGSTFRDNAQDALCATGASAITVTNSTFQDNAGYAVRVEADSVRQVTGNTFSGNGYNRVLIGAGSVTAEVSLGPQTGLESYELEGDVTVSSGVTLTVQPGSVVMGRSGAHLQVQGHLEALGSQPITFTSSADSAPNQWEGLYFNGGTGNLRHATVRYGGQSNGYKYSSITVRDVLTGEVRIEGSQVISGSNYYADYGLYAINSNLVVSDTLFAYNGNGANDYPLWLDADDLHRVQLTDLTFNNNAQNLVYLSGGSLAGDAALSAHTGLEGYVLGGSVTAPAGVTLTVEPELEILGTGYGVGLTVQGHLVAQGTVTQPITCTRQSGGSFRGILLSGANATGDLDYVVVKDAYPYTQEGGFHVEDGASLTLCNSQVLTTTGTWDGVYVDNGSTAFIENGRFVGNGRAGVHIKNSTATISNSLFVGNGYAMHLQNDLPGLQLVGNTLQGNDEDQVRLQSATLLSDTILPDQTGLEGYALDGDLDVPAGVTLTVEPGVSFLGTGYGDSVDVEGRLVAVGTDAEPITFTHASGVGGGFAGVLFTGANATGLIDHVIVRDAYAYGLDGAVHVENGASISLHNSQVLTTTIYPGVESGIYVNNGATMTIESAVVAYNGQYGVEVRNSTVTISDTQVLDNGDGVYVYGNSAITVTNSTFQDNAGRGVAIAGGTATVKGSTIQSNGNNGLYNNGGTLIAYANTVTDNTGDQASCSGGASNVRHNYWGNDSINSNCDPDYDYRLGAPIVSWGEGSLSDGASISGGAGIGVIVDHGSTVPFNKPAVCSGTPCSAFYDFFTAPGASGDWTVTVPVSDSVACDTTFNEGKLFHFALDVNNAPDLTCSPDSACWVAYTGVVSNTGTPRTLQVSVATDKLGGTPIVTGDENGGGPTVITLVNFSARLPRNTWHSVTALIASLLVVAGGAFCLARRWR